MEKELTMKGFVIRKKDSNFFLSGNSFTSELNCADIFSTLIEANHELKKKSGRLKDIEFWKDELEVKEIFLSIK